jgi:hypothetical protein
MENLELKNFKFEIKAKDNGTFEGYGSVFGNIDSHKDIVEPGAFKKTLKEAGDRVKFLWQHDPWQPIGKPTDMAEDSKGLHVKGVIAPTQLGKDALILMKEGILDELSIGYNTVKEEWDNNTGIRRIKEVKLWEISLVTFASNPLATVTNVKNLQGIERLATALQEEFKAGKMLSDKNKQIVLDAITALQTLVDASEGQKAEPFTNTHIVKKEDQQAVLEIQSIIAEMQKYTKNRG